jgi:glycosyltransferase involved in cell wall biosynthesis
LSPHAAGIFEFLKGLARSLEQTNCEVTVIGLCGGNTDDSALWKPVNAVLVPAIGPKSFPVALGLNRILREIKPDLIHSHGLWAYHGLAIPAFCRRQKIPYIVSPHGMLEPWAWRHKAWKKRPVWWTWERRFLAKAAVLHATAEQESNNLRSFGLRNSTAVLPVGLQPPPLEQPDKENNSGDKIVLFLSRIHPIKGLPSLVEAWSHLRPHGWRVVVAGPDEGGHLAQVQADVYKAGLQNSFDFVGPVEGAEKWQLYRAADLFALPTMSENFGIVVAEALACGVPVITTKGAPWEELVTQRCGWWIDKGVQPLTAALREAMALSDEQRKSMGQRGRRMVEQNYSWPKIAADMKSVYEWVLGSGPKPGCIV